MPTFADTHSGSNPGASSFLAHVLTGIPSNLQDEIRYNKCCEYNDQNTHKTLLRVVTEMSKDYANNSITAKQLVNKLSVLISTAVHNVLSGAYPRKQFDIACLCFLRICYSMDVTQSDKTAELFSEFMQKFNLNGQYGLQKEGLLELIRCCGGFNNVANKLPFIKMLALNPDDVEILTDPSIQTIYGGDFIKSLMVNNIKYWNVKPNNATEYNKYAEYYASMLTINSILAEYKKGEQMLAMMFSNDFFSKDSLEYFIKLCYYYNQSKSKLNLQFFSQFNTFTDGPILDHFFKLPQFRDISDDYLQAILNDTSDGMFNVDGLFVSNDKIDNNDFDTKRGIFECFLSNNNISSDTIDILIKKLYSIIEPGDTSKIVDVLLTKYINKISESNINTLFSLISWEGFDSNDIDRYAAICKTPSNAVNFLKAKEKYEQGTDFIFLFIILLYNKDPSLVTHDVLVEALKTSIADGYAIPVDVLLNFLCDVHDKFNNIFQEQDVQDFFQILMKSNNSLFLNLVIKMPNVICPNMPAIEEFRNKILGLCKTENNLIFLLSATPINPNPMTGFTDLRNFVALVNQKRPELIQTNFLTTVINTFKSMNLVQGFDSQRQLVRMFEKFDNKINDDIAKEIIGLCFQLIQQKGELLIIISQKICKSDDNVIEVLKGCLSDKTLNKIQTVISHCNDSLVTTKVLDFIIANVFNKVGTDINVNDAIKMLNPKFFKKCNKAQIETILKALQPYLSTEEYYGLLLRFSNLDQSLLKSFLRNVNMSSISSANQDILGVFFDQYALHATNEKQKQRCMLLGEMFLKDANAYDKYFGTNLNDTQKKQKLRAEIDDFALINNPPTVPKPSPKDLSIWTENDNDLVIIGFANDAVDTLTDILPIEQNLFLKMQYTCGQNMLEFNGKKEDRDLNAGEPANSLVNNFQHKYIFISSTKADEKNKIPKDLLSYIIKSDSTKRQDVVDKLNNMHPSIKKKIPWIDKFIDNCCTIIGGTPRIDTLKFYYYLLLNEKLNDVELGILRTDIKAYFDAYPNVKSFHELFEETTEEKELNDLIDICNANLSKINILKTIVDSNPNSKNAKKTIFKVANKETANLLNKAFTVLTKLQDELDAFKISVFRNKTGTFTSQVAYEEAINNVKSAEELIKQEINKTLNEKIAQLAQQIQVKERDNRDKIEVFNKLKDAKDKMQNDIKDNDKIIDNDFIQQYVALVSSIVQFNFTDKKKDYNALNNFQSEADINVKNEIASIRRQISDVDKNKYLSQKQKDEMVARLEKNSNDFVQVAKEGQEKIDKSDVEQLKKFSAQIQELRKENSQIRNEIKKDTNEIAQDEKQRLMEIKTKRDVQDLQRIIDDKIKENSAEVKKISEEKKVIITEDANKYAKNIKSLEDCGWFYDTANKTLGIATPVVVVGTIVGATLIPVATIPIAIVGSVLGLLGFSTFVYRRNEKQKEIKEDRIAEKIQIQKDAFKGRDYQLPNLSMEYNKKHKHTSNKTKLKNNLKQNEDPAPGPNK